VQIEMSLTLPRDGRFLAPARTSLRALLRPLAVPEGVVDDLQLALTEACSNAIAHARATRRYRVALDVDAGACTVRVTDEGPGFSTASLPPDEPDPWTEAGRGLQVIEAVADDLSVEQGERGMIVRFTKFWPDDS
jgi:serine/threonine-protein kinase RsbW